MAKRKANATVDSELGSRLRRLREARGLTVRSLASLAGVTPGTLSKIENRKTSPAVSTLKDILQALGTTLGDFFAMQEERTGEKRCVFRPGELVNLSSTSGMVFLGLPVATERGTLQILHETYAPGTGTGRKPLRHPGEDGGFCLSGTMELTIDGRREILGPGDAFHHRSDLPHRWRNVGSTPAEMVTACTPPTF